MTVYAGLRIEGGRELRATLKAAGSDLSELREAHKAAANVVLQKAKGWAPRRSGRLAGSMRIGATKRAGIVRAGNNRKGKAAIPYANPIHWGWESRNIKANPFLSYSAQATEHIWVNEYVKAVNDALKKVRGK